MPASMKHIALLSDIHGNWHALQAVLEDIARRQIDSIICLGDVAVDGPHPQECVRQLRQISCPIVMGNTDSRLLSGESLAYRDEDTEKYNAVQNWSRQQLTDQDFAFIQTFQPTVSTTLATGAEALCFHGSPNSFNDLIVAGTSDDELKRMFDGFSALIMAGGHSHAQLLRRFNQTIFVNPGSVGLPYERIAGGSDFRHPPWAEYAVLTMKNEQVEVTYYRIPYDVQSHIAAINAKKMPYADWLTTGWNAT